MKNLLEMSKMDSRITGTWKLKSFELKSKEGDIFYPLGENPEGFLIYDKSGHMSGMMSRSDRPNLSSENLTQIKDDEKLSLANGFIGYSGKYEVLDDKIIHNVEMSFIPNWVGKPLDRYYEFQNDDLILSTPPEILNGKEFIYYLLWGKL